MRIEEVSNLKVLLKDYKILILVRCELTVMLAIVSAGIPVPQPIPCVCFQACDPCVLCEAML